MEGGGLLCHGITGGYISASVRLRNADGTDWWLTVVYGLQLDAHKLLFLQEDPHSSFQNASKWAYICSPEDEFGPLVQFS